MNLKIIKSFLFNAILSAWEICLLPFILISKQQLVIVFYTAPEMFAVSYCQIYPFHSNLKLDKIVIFRSFQQNSEEICSLDHFSQEHIKYFDAITFNQLKDAARNVLVRQK